MRMFAFLENPNPTHPFLFCERAHMHIAKMKVVALAVVQ